MSSHILVITAFSWMTQARQGAAQPVHDLENEMALIQVNLLLDSNINGNTNSSFATDHSAMSTEMHTPPVVLDVTKIAWLHIPKTGTSFSNTLVTWGCPGLEDDAFVGEDLVDGGPRLNAGADPQSFIEKHASGCQHGFSLSEGHRPMSAGSVDEHSGNFVGMFRQPEQRLISGFYDNKHDYYWLKFGGTYPSAEKYARSVAGCSVSMLTGRFCGAFHAIGQKDLDLARTRLDNEFAFVGLTEEWDMSVCLFHAMFGSDVHHREVLNIREGSSSSNGLYDTTMLNGFVDEWDDKLYAHAQRIFWSNVEQFGVTRASCEAVLEEALAATQKQ